MPDLGPVAGTADVGKATGPEVTPLVDQMLKHHVIAIGAASPHPQILALPDLPPGLRIVAETAGAGEYPSIDKRIGRKRVAPRDRADAIRASCIIMHTDDRAPQQGRPARGGTSIDPPLGERLRMRRRQRWRGEEKDRKERSDHGQHRYPSAHERRPNA